MSARAALGASHLVVWHTACNVPRADTGRERTRLASPRWQEIFTGGVGSQSSEGAARRSGTSIGARSSGPPSQARHGSSVVTGASGTRGARTLDSKPLRLHRTVVRPDL